MLPKETEIVLNSIPGLQPAAKKVSRSIHQAVLNGGEQTRNTADILHGKWLGHPLHPVLTDITVGAWGLTAIFDLIYLFTRSKSMAKTADSLAVVGTLSALPTAAAGLTDFSTIPSDAAGRGLIHALLNITGLLLFSSSLRARQVGRRSRGIFASMLGITLATVSAYLGREMVYRLKVGVNHRKPVSEPKMEPPEWTAVLPDGELAEHQARRIDLQGVPIMLYRYGGVVYAIGAVCSHAGGPLELGKFDGLCVQCPWHDSVFDIRDGCVVHSPATVDEPVYPVRIINDQIEIGLTQSKNNHGA